MKLIWVTGSPASGKSTIARTVRETGLPVYDLDDGPLTFLRNRTTGERIPARDLEPGWFSNIECLLDLDAAAALADTETAPVAFIFGTAPNMEEAASSGIFTVIVFLDVSLPIIEQRLAERAADPDGNQFGALPDELDAIRIYVATARERIRAAAIDTPVLLLSNAGNPEETISTLLTLARNFSRRD